MATISLLNKIFYLLLLCLNCNCNLLELLMPTDATINNNNSTLCTGKLYNDDNLLNINEINYICSTLIISSNYMIRIRTKPTSLVSNSILLQGKSERFFYAKCSNFLEMCEKGFLIDIYTEEAVIIIQPGKLAKKIVQDDYRKRVIESIRYEIIENNWSETIVKTVLLLDYKNKGGTTILNYLENPEPEKFWKILLKILVVGFLGLSSLLYFIGKGICNKSVFLYMDKILNFWEEIVNSPDCQIILPARTCLFCFKSESPEMEGKTIFKFLYCNHSYHSRCFYRWGLEYRQSCPCSFEPIEGEEFSSVNSSRPPYLNTEDLSILLGYILDAYRKEEIFDFFIENERRIDEMNRYYDISIQDMCWVYYNKLAYYKKFRIIFKMWKALKLMCCLIAFYPSKLMNSKKGKLIRKLLNVKSSGSTIKGFK
jgi:hypothetical protein